MHSSSVQTQLQQPYPDLRLRSDFVAVEALEGHCLLAASDFHGIVQGLGEALRDEGGVAAGRGVIRRIGLPRGEAVVRRCRRGGLARLFLNDSYLFVNRPLREFRTHVVAYNAGLPVPEPLGVYWQRRGLAFRGALITRALNARTLKEAIAANPSSPTALREAGIAIHHMHEVGIEHADLNIDNIMVDATRAYLLDFDNARIHKKLGRIARAKNLLRLRRSIRKSGMPDSVFDGIRAGYGAVRIPWWLRVAYGVKATLGDVTGFSKSKKH